MKIKHPKMIFRPIEIKVGMRNVAIHMMVISFSLMKSMEVSFLGSSDQIELKLVHLNIVQINFLTLGMIMQVDSLDLSPRIVIPQFNMTFN